MIMNRRAKIFPYTIECRLQGTSKHQTNKILTKLHDRFGVRLVDSILPRVQLLDSFNTDNPQKLKHILSKIASRHKPIPYNYTSEGSFKYKTLRNIRVAYLNFKPSEDMIKLGDDIKKELYGIIELKKSDDIQYNCVLHVGETSPLNKTHDINVSGMCNNIDILKDGNIMNEFILGSGKILSRNIVITHRHGYKKQHRK